MIQNKRISKRDKETLHKRIEDIIILKTHPFTAYEITKEIAKEHSKSSDKITLNDFMKFGNHVHTVMGKMESGGIIRFLKEADSYSPTKKRLFVLVK